MQHDKTKENTHHVFLCILLVDFVNEGLLVLVLALTRRRQKIHVA